MAITVQMRTEVSQLYVALFGRAPDGEGLGFWVGLRNSGQSLTQIANAMYATEPARAYYPGFLTNGEIISSFYVNVLGRTADAEGLAFWTAKLNASGATPGSVITEMINVVANYTGTDPAGLTSQALFNNKVSVAQYYGEHDGNIQGATIVLATVTSDAATVTAAKAAIDNGSIGQSGLDLSLSASQDAIAGSAANDTVHGLFGGAGDTYTPGDSIDLGQGVLDRLDLVVTGGTVSPAIIVKNTESINIQDTVGGKFDALLVENAPAIKFTNTVAGQTSTVINAGLASTYGLAGAGNLTVDFAGTSGAADTAKVSLSGAGTSASVRSTVDVSDANTVEAVTIATSGTNFVTLRAGGAGTVTVTGNGTNTINVGSIKTTATIDASASTGTNTFNLGTELSHGDVVTGGTGADTVSFNATAAAVGVFTFTGVETVKADVDVDATLSLAASTGIKTLIVDGGTGNATFTNAKSELATVNITSQGDTNNDLKLSYATGEVGKLTVNLGTTGTSAANVTMDDMTFTRVESFTLNAVGTKALAVDAIDLTSAATSISVNGGVDSDMRVNTIDASGASDVAVSMTVGASGDVYVGDGFSGGTGVVADSYGDINMNIGSGAFGAFQELDAVSGGIGDVNITVASGGSGYISGYAHSGAIGDVTLTVGEDAGASFSGYASGGFDVGNISATVAEDGYGFVTVSASDDGSAGGHTGNLDVTLAHNANFSGNSFGTESVGDTTVTGADGSFADIRGYAFQDAGNVSVNIGNDAGFSGSFTGYSGDAGSANITLGDDSYGFIRMEGGTSVGAITLAAGEGSDGYAYSHTHGGVAGAITMTGGDAGSFGFVSAGGDSIDAINLAGWQGFSHIDANGIATATVISAGVSGSDVWGGAGDDVINGGLGEDTMHGNGGADVITGGDSGDTLFGEDGADVLNGDAGNDAIDGGAGADAIRGGAGKDTMTGGTEADTFVFTGGNLVTAAAITSFTGSTDVITDFATASDKLNFPVAGTVANYGENTTAAASLAALLSAADTALNGTVKYYFGVVGTDGYLVYSENGTQALAVVELTGLVDMAATDIV